MFTEQRVRYGSEWEAIRSIPEENGCSAETFRNWIRQFQVDSGTGDGVTSGERGRMPKLEGEKRELGRAKEVLRKPSAYFAQAELDRPPKWWCASPMMTTRNTGSRRLAASCPSLRGLSASTRCEKAIHRGSPLPFSVIG